MVAIATYLMAVDSNGAAWIVLAIAGVVTLAMPAIPLQLLRQLRAMIASQELLSSRRHGTA